MDSTSTPALRRIWADATPLSKFIEDRAEQLCREGPATTGKTPGNRKPTAFEGIALVLEYQGNLNSARNRARTETINHLVAGRFVGLGRRSASYDIETIDSSFWIGADVGGDTVARGDTKIIEVRIVQPDVVQSIQPKPHSGLGRPSESKAIQEAISVYAKTDPALKRSPSVRYEAYRKHLASQGHNPKDPGFDKKTLQKYETEYRKGKFK